MQHTYHEAPCSLNVLDSWRGSDQRVQRSAKVGKLVGSQDPVAVGYRRARLTAESEPARATLTSATCRRGPISTLRLTGRFASDGGTMRLTTRRAGLCSSSTAARLPEHTAGPTWRRVFFRSWRMRQVDCLLSWSIGETYGISLMAATTASHSLFQTYPPIIFAS